MTAPLTTSAILTLAREALADDKKATPGPWRRIGLGRIVQEAAHEQIILGDMRWGSDAERIASARTREPQLAAWVERILDHRGTGPLRVNAIDGMIVLSEHHPKMDNSHVKARFRLHHARILVADLLLAIEKLEEAER